MDDEPTTPGHESPGTQPPGPHAAGYEELAAAESDAAARATARWWTDAAPDYVFEHGASLGDVALQWGPEGLREDEAGLLGTVEELRGAAVLEVGCGAAQGARWLVSRGVDARACDISPGMLAQAAAIDERTGISVPTFVADARDLPVADASLDVVFTAHGAVAFVADAARIHAEAARVLRPGGRWVFSVGHPIRWAFPDDPGPGGLTATSSYFDRRPYVERGAGGAVLYAEFHRTLGDHVRDVVGAGLAIVDLVEPEWPEGREEVWGGWSPLRGRLLPGTAIFVCVSPG